MATPLELAADLIGRCDQAVTAAAAGQTYYDMLQGFGAKSLVIADRRGEVTRHFTLQGPDGWFDYYFGANLRRGNPIFRELGIRPDAFSWDQLKTQGQDDGRWYRALEEFGMPRGMSIPCHGPGGYFGWVSFTAEDLDFSPIERRVITLAGLAVHDRSRVLSGPLDVPNGPKLTDRERDCIAFVADGKSDWEISVILGIAQATVHAHIENGKRKLATRTRAQAVARALRAGLI